MAKKQKGKSKLKKQIKFELLGFLFIALSIFGSGASLISDGIIPRSLEYILRFFFGIWFFVASIFLLITGSYLIIKRRYPNFKHKRFIGIYITFLGLILLTHIQTLEKLVLLNEIGNISILKTSWENYMSYVKGIGVSSQIGGGMIGGILFTLFSYLFSVAGTKLIAIFLMIIGVILITEVSIGDFFSKAFKYLKNNFTKLINYFKNKQNRRHKDKRLEINNSTETDIREDTEELSQPREKTLSISEFSEQAPILEYTDDKNVSAMKTERKHEKIDIEDESQDEKLMKEMDQSSIGEQENTDYQLPTFDLLNPPQTNKQQKERSQIQETARKLEATFKSFGVKAQVTKVHVGPAVTKYEVYPDAGVKVSRIVNLHDDLALALAAKDIRIEAPIPGKSAVGIEVPNEEVAMVSLVEVLQAKHSEQEKLLFALGRDISGNAIAGNLSSMPHLLIAGATGSGKSVCINGIITTILMRTKPHEVKMMMIDPKKVELNVYNGVPHLLTPVVTDPRKASQALQKVVSEMERRYDLFSTSGTRNIEGYNNYVENKNEKDGAKNPFLPYIVVIVDELADLMMVASSDVEDAIARLAQMARAAGIHLIIATQRPSVDVITGVIKANIPSRIAFSVSSQTDSRTILDTGGAEKLLGKGDMLYMPVGDSKPTRVQGAFLTDQEVERVVNHCIEQQIAVYEESMIPDETETTQSDVDDDLYDDAVQLIIEADSASVSMLQRRLRIGYNRAARLIDAMEERGIVGPHEGSKPRTVLISRANDDSQESEVL